ncbi:hypothetical protein ACFE04_010806 [Oxalis oulophora]
MRFHKGSKVEVLGKTETPPGSWHCAEIVSGSNGGDYTVKYAGERNEKILETISRKIIRPRPPLSEFSMKWVPGDVVEVFDDYSWKMATVVKVLHKKKYLVRLIGSSLEFKASVTDIRVRQSWEDHKWVVIGGKGSGNYEDRKHGENLCGHQNLVSRVFKINTRMNLQAKADFFPVENTCILQKPRFGSFRNLKRSSANETSQLDGFFRAAKKKRRIDNDNKSNNSDNMVCSVGSCSINNNNSYVVPTEFIGSFSDAESYCQWGNEEQNIPVAEENLVPEVHELELYAYRQTIGALHAAGPLSWEQEALMTNLRLFLNISNDEHLIEIRSLITAANSIPYRL